MSEAAKSNESPEMIDELEGVSRKFVDAKKGIGRVIFGQEEVIEEALITLLAGGHMLLIGVPGLGKTRLVETMGTVLGMEDRRVQFTPDLMPATFWAPKCWRNRRPGDARSASSRDRCSASC